MTEKRPPPTEAFLNVRGCYDDLVPLVLREVLAFADDLVLYAFPAEG